MQGDRVEVEQVAGEDRLGLRSEELPPRDTRPLRRWVNTGALQDAPHGAGPDLVAETAQLTVDAAVACGCQKVSRTLRAAGSPRETLIQMIGGWRYDCSI